MPIGISIFFISFFTLALVHNLALNFYLYWRYDWFDIFMHFLGGVSVALFISVLCHFKVPFFTKFPSIARAMLLVLIVSILWEVFELLGGIIVIDETFIPDTTLDLIMDMIGGYVGFSILKRISF